MNHIINKLDANRLLTIGEISKRSGVPISTIHFYEEKGLIKSTRNSSNHRRFPSYVLRYIAIIKIAQLTGISLEDIKESIGKFPTDRKLTKEGWEKISTQWKADLDRRITYLMRLRDELNDCIGCGCLSMERCPLRNPNDILGKEGTGARILNRPLDEEI